jgi:hypothetical protein
MAVTTTTTIEPNFDRKLEIITTGLPKEHSNLLEKVPREDALTVMDYMISLNAEVNPSVNYRKGIIKCLTDFIVFSHRSIQSKDRNSLKQYDRKDVLAFLDSFRKSEAEDPLHRWKVVVCPRALEVVSSTAVAISASNRLCLKSYE